MDIYIIWILQYMYNNLLELHSFCRILHTTVQITFIFIGQTHLVFGKRVCTCVTKHSNEFRTFLNWLKNSKRVWHEPKLHILCLPIFANFDKISTKNVTELCGVLVDIRYPPTEICRLTFEQCFYQLHNTYF